MASCAEAVVGTSRAVFSCLALKNNSASGSPSLYCLAKSSGLNLALDAGALTCNNIFLLAQASCHAKGRAQQP